MIYVAAWKVCISMSKYLDISSSIKSSGILLRLLHYVANGPLAYPNELWSNCCGVSRPNEVCHPLKRR
jgi:hypothetical protein